MPARFELYRVVDGVTRLGGSFLNRVFGDMDTRIAELENVKASWEGAIKLLTDQGLLRINAVMGPSLEALNGILDDARASLLDLQVNGLSAVIATFDPIKADLATAKTAANTATAAATAAANTAINAAANIPAIRFYTWDNRGNVRTDAVPGGTSLVIIDGLGIFTWIAGNNQPDDDETAFATASPAGVWLLAASHWDIDYANWLPDIDLLKSRLDALKAQADAADTRDVSFEGKVLKGTASCTLSNLAAGAGFTFTGTIAGALVGSPVVATPPAAMDQRTSITAYVSAANTITVQIGNPSATALSSSLGTGTWGLLVVNP